MLSTIKISNRLRYLISALSVSSVMMGCSDTHTTNKRSGPEVQASIGLTDIWSEEGLSLTSTVAAFEILVECDGGYTQSVTTSEFSLPIRNRNCIAKLKSFDRSGNRHYEPKSGLDFTTWRPSERAVFECTSGIGCDGSPDLNVYVLKQLPAPTLTVFAEVRYKFAENSIGDDVVIQKTDINFSKVVVGDEPPPFTLRAAYEGADLDKLEMMAECNEFQIGGSLADAICATTSMNSLRVALAPWPSGEVTIAKLQDIINSSSVLLAAEPGAILVDQGQFGIGRGGFTVALPADDATDYIFAMTTSGSDSYTYHRIVRASEASTYTVGGTVSGIESGSIGLKLDPGSEEIQVNGNGGFTFARQVKNLEGYLVQILNVPADHNCAIANNEGTIDGQSITNVKVVCQRQLN